MNLQATLFLYGGGPGSGCQGPDCGRKPGAASPPPLAQRQEDVSIDKRVMSLTLKTHGIPLLFENDDRLNWEWSADKKILHIEIAETKADEFPTGFSEKTVYDVPASNIAEWYPSDGPQWKN